MKKLVLTILIFMVFQACVEKPSNRIRIAISKEKSDKSTTKYADWLLNADSTIDYFYMYPLGIDSAIELLSTCNGLLVTGGEDVFPGYYGKVEDTARCGTFDRYRDSLEMAVINAAIVLKIPIFGICRGEQIININRGGTLYIDIPSDFDTIVKHRNEDWSRCYHPVWIVDNSTLNKIAPNPKDFDIVTSHHQGIEVLGKDLRIMAYAYDSLPEAIEWDSTVDHPYLMATQWHPEAMDYEHDLSLPLAFSFIEAAKNHHCK